MRTKRYFFLTLILACLATFSMEAQGTANYSQDGIYQGTAVHSYYIDFTKFPITALPSPVVSEDIQELANLGLKRWQIESRNTKMTDGSQTGSKVNTLFAKNPTIEGKDNTVNPAYIYFPTLKDGAGRIRISGWVANNSTTPKKVYLDYWNAENNDWMLLKTIYIPGNGTNIADSTVNLTVPVNLRIRNTETAWLSFTAIVLKKT